VGGGIRRYIDTVRERERERERGGCGRGGGDHRERDGPLGDHGDT
jgi:hypothetical protein